MIKIKKNGFLKRRRSGNKQEKSEIDEPTTNHLIQLKRVNKTYRTDAGDFVALDRVDLTAEAGEFVAILGKSGSGKSTLINMISGIDVPTLGEVWVDGIAVHTLGQSTLAKWRGRHLGIVFQFFQLLPTLTVAQNVMLPMDFCHTYPVGERRERALFLLDQMSIANLADKLPSAISGGEQQRAAIARALANDPPILLADEPTGNLDSQTADVIFQLFRRLVDEGKTVLMVTHNRELARQVSRTLTVADGRIVGDGSNDRRSV